MLCHALSVSRTTGAALVLLLVALLMAWVGFALERTRVGESCQLGIGRNPIHWFRCEVKFLGFLCTVGLLGIWYWLLPEYRKPFYQPGFDILATLLPLILAAAFPYIVWVDRRMKEPQDGYWHFGSLVMGQWRQVDWKEIRGHVAGWAVKGFFLPFMLGAASGHLDLLLRKGIDFDTFSMFYGTTLNVIVTVDVVFGALGYLLTLRILDSHIRSVEPTVLGWCVALYCYPPFAHFLRSNSLEYRGPYGKENWQFWVFDQPVLYISWGFAILVLHGIYAWATVSFGCRFSNLTNRGIITGGPYRYLRHPAYVCKNLAWWLMYIPFVGHGSWQGNLRACLFLLLLNGIYGLRAWTEERHLRKDPAYVEYCRWMDEHGLWSRVRNYFFDRINKIGKIYKRLE